MRCLQRWRTPDGPEPPAMSAPVSLVCMPWPLADMASIQLGTLSAVLERAGISTRCHSLYLKFLEFCNAPGLFARQRLSVSDYREISSTFAHLLAGEWVFAVPPVRVSSAEMDREFTELLRRGGMDGKLQRKLRHVRNRIPEFLELCEEEVLQSDPAVVGFSVGYTGRFAALSLAHRLKERQPGLRIVFGGSQCEGSMGKAMLEAFPWVDIVVSGEGENVLPQLATALLAGEPPPLLPEVFVRNGDAIQTGTGIPDPVRLSESPPPIFDEYFARLQASPIATKLVPELPFESSRGCWWGAKSHCTFCGISAEQIRFRSKPPGRLAEEVLGLVKKHGVLSLTALDNVLDMNYFDTLLPELAQRDLDLNIFYEVRAVLTRRQVEALRAAGVQRIQPGIESLSTPLLKLMRKGTTALHNIRLLKWCRELGITVFWNLLYGLPDEPVDEYRRMARLIPSLVHLDPPQLLRLELDRFSPYFEDPEKFGLRNLGPGQQYRLLYDVDDRLLAELAQFFDHDHVNGDDTEAYLGEIQKAVALWNKSANRFRDALIYRKGPGFLEILDRRQPHTPALYRLEELETAVYLACDAGTPLAKITAQVEDALGCKVARDDVVRALDDMVDAQLVFREGCRYLSLAVPCSRVSRASDPGPSCSTRERGLAGSS